MKNPEVSGAGHGPEVALVRYKGRSGALPHAGDLPQVVPCPFPQNPRWGGGRVPSPRGTLHP